MLKPALLFLIIALALAMLMPDLLQRLPLETAPAASLARAAPPAAARGAAAAPREQLIASDAGGQYSVDALVGGQSVHMLVDTGATMVVISAALADRIGLSPESGRKWRVHTANGDSVATEALIPSIDLGSIYMVNVPALIADRSAGDVNLLGASFLRRLASVEQRNGVLTLRQ